MSAAVTSVAAHRPSASYSQFTPVVVRMAVGDIRPYAGNPRRHDKRQVARLASSIQAYGWITPVVVDGGGVIVAGHARYAAALSLGLSEVPVIRADHLTPAEVRAYRLADNKLAEDASWDEELLRIELGELLILEAAGELDIGITGFEMAEIDLVLEGSSAKGAVETEVESVELPEEGAVAVTRPGDLWLLSRTGVEGGHRLLCGSALEPAAYALLLGDGEEVRLVFTDPPYNVPVLGHVRVKGGSRAAGGGTPQTAGTSTHREFGMASGEMSEVEFFDFNCAFVRSAAAHVVEGGVMMACMDWRGVETLMRAGRTEGLSLINFCVWSKTNGGMGSLYRSQHELVCIFKKGRAPHINNVQLGKHGRYRTNVWIYPGVDTFRRGREADLVDHPTVKPNALVADAIKDVTHRGDVVLDPFGGSGTTMLAAEKTGRCARLIELDPLYVDVAIRRWQALTGEEAVLAGTGQTFAEVRETRAAERTVPPEPAEAAHSTARAAVQSAGEDAVDVEAVPTPDAVTYPQSRPTARIRVRASRLPPSGGGEGTLTSRSPSSAHMAARTREETRHGHA